MTKWWAALASALGLICVALAAYAASPQWDQSIAIVDSVDPHLQARVTSTGALKVDGSAGGGGAVTLAAGSAIAGKFGIDQTTPGTTNLVAAGQNGTWTVQPGNTANTTAWLTQPVAGTAGGASSSFLQPLASDNHATIKAGAGTLYGVIATNNSVTINYLRFYNATTAFNGCNSATNIITQVAILPSGGVSVFIPVGIAFATGLSICVTSGYATTDTTAATAAAMSITTVYQ